MSLTIRKGHPYSGGASMEKKPVFISLRYKLQSIILFLVALPLVVVAGTAYTLNAQALSERIMQSNANALIKERSKTP